MIATSSVSIVNVNDGATGATGPQGVSVTKVVEEYRLSNSSTELTGSGTGYTWSETKPDIPSGKYLWIRERTDLSNNTSSYGTAHCDIVISGLVQDVDRNSGVITSKVWESYTQNSINQYDGSTGAAIRDRVTQTETSITGITSRVSDVESETDSLGTRMTSAESSITQNADNIALMVTVDGTSSSLTLTQNMLTAMTSQFVVKDPAGSATIISGGKIHANAITTAMLAANAIKSTNYSSGTSGSDVPANNYSTSGTFLDLTTGNIYTPNFAVNSVNGEAYLNGTIFASAGQIGNPGDAYWSIGTVYDSTWGDYAGLIANGNALIQSGKLTLSSDRLNSQNAGNYIQSGGYWYDFGLQVPDFTAGTNSHDQNFLYVRRIGHQPTDSTLDTDWSYLFRVDKSGNIYWNGHDISDGTFLPLSGGTVTGATTFGSTLTVNGKLTASSAIQTNIMLQTNLGSTSAGQLTGNANATVTHGVTGTLGVGNGGTGATSFTSGAVLIGNGGNAIQTRAIRNNTTQGALGWTSSSADNTIITTNTLAYWDGRYQTANNASNIQYVKLGKLGTVVTHNIEEFITTSGGVIDGSLSVVDLSAGNLIVTGAGRFTNGLYGDLIGNADTATTAATADKVGSNLVILLNGGTTEGTNKFTYNGSAAKNVNITKSSIGLGNVENTALSTWAGSANLTTTKVGTLAAAAVKGVDTSISASSTSANLPTSAAVAAFVEGKGYVTSSGVTSVRVQATSPVISSVNTAQSSTLNTTISLADGYGDTKNPYGTKTKNYVLAGPTTGNAAAPTFRALVAADIPTLTPAKAGLGNVTNDKQVKGLSSGTTSGHLVSWGADGYTVADSGVANGSVTTKITLAGSDYSASSNTITITQANLQSAVQSTSLVLMTSAERSKLESIQVSEGGTIDFSGVTASSPLTATVGTNKTVNITHNTSGVSAGTYRSVTVNTYGHVTAGTNPTTLSGYGITDAKIASGVITLGSNTITPLTASSTLDATKLSGTASISTTGNATTATKFSSNRSITLTGDVVGTSSSNGENGWSLTTAIVDDSHNHTTETIVPLQTKTYTEVIAAANDEAKGQLYFIKVQPETYSGQWSIRYKVTATINGVSVANGSGYETSEVYLSGMRDTYSGYRTWNDITHTSYRPYYYHCFYRAKEAGITGGYGHVLGINLRYSYNPTTSANARTVTFEIIETKGCTVTFFDSPIIYANLPGTGTTNYNTYNNFDATTQGNTMSGDRNDVNYYNRNYYGSRTAAANIYRYQLCLTKKDRSILPINSVNNDITTNKTLTTEAFDPFGDILYWASTTTYNAGANVGDGWYAQYLADIRYSFNIGGYNTTSTLVARKPLYLVATPQADGTAILNSSPLAQDLPTTDDGLIYIYLGQVYQDTYPYRLYLTIHHPIYIYKNGSVRNYVQYADYATSASSAASATISNQVAGNAGTSNADRHVWFSDSSTETARNYDDDFKYNPSTNTLKVANLSGNASSATKATQDSDGHAINTTYAKLSGATFTGAVTGTSFAASNYMTVNSGNSGTAGGLALYGTTPTSYGIAMRQTANGGKHGYVQGDWSIYNYMSGATNRGFVWKAAGTNVASIDGLGDAAFNGNVTIGTTGTDINGSCSLVMDRNLNCLNFIFN